MKVLKHRQTKFYSGAKIPFLLAVISLFFYYVTPAFAATTQTAYSITLINKSNCPNPLVMFLQGNAIGGGSIKVSKNSKASYPLTFTQISQQGHCMFSSCAFSIQYTAANNSSESFANFIVKPDSLGGVILTSDGFPAPFNNYLKVEGKLNGSCRLTPLTPNCNLTFTYSGS